MQVKESCNAGGPCRIRSRFADADASPALKFGKRGQVTKGPLCRSSGKDSAAPARVEWWLYQ